MTKDQPDNQQMHGSLPVGTILVLVSSPASEGSATTARVGSRLSLIPSPARRAAMTLGSTSCGCTTHKEKREKTKKTKPSHGSSVALHRSLKQEEILADHVLNF